MKNETKNATDTIREWAEARYSKKNSNGVNDPEIVAEQINATEAGRAIAMRYAYALSNFKQVVERLSAITVERPHRITASLDDDFVRNAAMLFAADFVFCRFTNELRIANESGPMTPHDERAATVNVVTQMTDYVVNESRFNMKSTSQIRNASHQAETDAVAELIHTIQSYC